MLIGRVMNCLGSNCSSSFGRGVWKCGPGPAGGAGQEIDVEFVETRQGNQSNICSGVLSTRGTEVN